MGVDPHRSRSLVRASRAMLWVALWMVAPGVALGGEAHLIDFELEDQFERIHRRADVDGQIVLLIGSDKGGSEFNGSWTRAIREVLGEHPRYWEVSHLAHADLRGVPFFIKGMLRGKFPQDEDQWVLMDWKGELAKAYDFVAKSSNILLFASDGSLVRQASGREPDDETVDGITRALLALLDVPR